MTIHFNSERFQLLLIGNRPFLPGKTGQNDRTYIETISAKGINQSQNIHIVGDAQISANFILLNITRMNGNDNFRILFQFTEHTDLTVRVKTG